jgi:hypothetical protein
MPCTSFTVAMLQLGPSSVTLRSGKVGLHLQGTLEVAFVYTSFHALYLSWKGRTCSRAGPYCVERISLVVRESGLAQPGEGVINKLRHVVLLAY